MNVSIINIKDLTKYIIIVLVIIILFFFSKIIFNMIDKIDKLSLFKNSSQIYFSLFSVIDDNSKTKTNKEIELLKYNYPIIASINNKPEIQSDIKEDDNLDQNIIIKEGETESVFDRNIEESYNYVYDDVKIKNQSNYDLTDDYFKQDDVLFKNKKVVIYHTHTCESYTPSPEYNYEMTGNYRTTDLNYNVSRVGEELKKYLEEKGFTVIHDSTYHDYPSYNGSYDRSFETIEKIINENPDTEIVIDLHRDAVGDGSWYGPTIKINENSVAQMMFVIRY